MAEASFTGEEFLKYLFDGNTEGDSFVMHFKTKQPAGLLYHIGKIINILAQAILIKILMYIKPALLLSVIHEYCSIG